MAVLKSKKFLIGIFAIGVAALAVFIFRPGGYSESHPYLFHDCRALASLCPSGTAIWAPPGGTNPSQHHIYGLCACSATITVHGG
jgi:hypothetical protein